MGNQRRIAILTELGLTATGTLDSTGLRTACLLSSAGFAITFVAAAPEHADVEPILVLLDSVGIATSNVTAGPSPGLPIDAMFSADCCLIDIDDIARFRFLADLPVHTWPGARLAGVVDRLVGRDPSVVAEIIERLDAVCGSMPEAVAPLGIPGEESLTDAVLTTMRTGNLRSVLVQDDGGAIVSIADGQMARMAIDSTSSPLLDRTVAAACAALAMRLNAEETLHLAVNLQVSTEMNPLVWAALVADARNRAGV